MKPTNTHCSICGFDATSVYFLTKHRKEKHPETYYARTKPVVEEGSTLAKFQQGEQLIKAALRDIDVERNILQQKLLDLDNLAAKYKAVINPNGK
jgi:hypothetical protein